MKLGLGLTITGAVASRAPAPTVSAVTPSSGPSVGSTAITNLAGTGFVSGATVTIGGASATSVTFVSATKLTCTSPAGTAGARDVIVTNPDAQTSGSSGAGLFTYVDAPTVSAITPNSGSAAGSTSITDLHGTGFVNGATVTIGGASATSVAFVSATKLTCTTPSGTAGARDVAVTNPDSQTSGTSGNGLFTYIAVPALTSLNFAQGDTLGGGSSIIITGTGLSNATGVSFGGTAATITGNDATTVTVTLPAKTAGATTVTVTTPGGTSGTLAFEFWNPSTPSGCTAFCEAPDYAVADSTHGTWTARVGTNFSESTSARPTASGGAPVFGGASTLSGGNLSSNVWDGTNKVGSYAVILSSSSAATHNGGAPWSNPGVWAPVGGVALTDVMVSFDSVGFEFNEKDTSARGLQRAAPADGTKHINIGRIQTANAVAAGVDGNALTGSSIGTLAALKSANVRLGVNGDGLVFLNNATIYAVIFYNIFLSDGDATKLYKWAQQRHGVA